MNAALCDGTMIIYQCDACGKRRESCWLSIQAHEHTIHLCNDDCFAKYVAKNFASVTQFLETVIAARLREAEPPNAKPSDLRE